MNKALPLLLAGVLAGCSESGTPPPLVKPILVSGLDQQHFDMSVRPQDDLYRHVNGRWLAETEIPADKARYGVFDRLNEEAEQALRGLIESASNDADAATGSEKRKIGDLYASFMDEPRLESLGLKPLEGELARVEAIRSIDEIPTLIARFGQIGAGAPYVSYVHQDNRDSTRYVVDLYQSGLGLPDRDYYLKDGDDGAYRKAREAYAQHVEKMLSLSGDQNAAQSAQRILALETALARIQWSKVENRDPVKTYNKVELEKLPSLIAGYDWKRYLTSAGIDGKVDYLIVSQPSYLTGFGKLLQQTPLATWKTYLKWRLLTDYAPYLSKAFVDENFAFYGTALRGVPENRPRWKRGVDVVEGAIGEGLGKLYVEQYFPAENKARMEALVKNLLAAYRQSIDTLDWMSPATREQAQAKLAKFTTKIGYPGKWRDYSTLDIVKDDLVGNVMRGQAFEYQRNINKLGGPIDRDEWLMVPQLVNAYYNPEMNEIVFPAAILQPPFFNVKADDAVNYGSIGAVIGHEISHGFDDQGSQYDGDGNLRDWWTKEDHEKFSAKTRALVEQYAAYEPVQGYKVNGELTLGENIADNSGLAIAYKAYMLSLDGREAPMIDGMTGVQRFFAGWAQAWQEKAREKEAIRLVTIDPHSPARFRAIGASVNQDAFHEAFGVKEGEGMYLAPEKRVRIW